MAGIATLVQTLGLGPVGARLPIVQGTSFGFLSAILSAGFIVKARGGTPEEILATLFGVSFCAAFVEIAFSQCINKLRRVITPVVTGPSLSTVAAPTSPTRSAMRSAGVTCTNSSTDPNPAAVTSSRSVVYSSR